MKITMEVKANMLDVGNKKEPHNLCGSFLFPTLKNQYGISIGVQEPALTVTFCEPKSFPSWSFN